MKSVECKEGKNIRHIIGTTSRGLLFNGPQSFGWVPTDSGVFNLCIKPALTNQVYSDKSKCLAFHSTYTSTPPANFFSLHPSIPIKLQGHTVQLISKFYKLFHNLVLNKTNV